MSAGDVINPKRVRTQANERLDDVDAEALSLAPRTFLDAYSRAVEATPRNAGSTSPVGLIFQGFGLTLNPTGATDGKVRVQSPVGVAFDSDGRMLIKESGVTTDLTIPSGGASYQIYAYFIDDSTDTTLRRFISVTSPYVESGNAVPTSLKGDVAYWVRSGNQSAIVSTDVVNGQTTALCFLGIASNSGGTIAMAGYDLVDAPNGQYATNRVSTVVAPATPPPANTAGGTLATILDTITAALYSVGQAMWKGSGHLTPAVGNNFGAYKIPAGGVDKAFRQALGYVTIGDGSTIFGDFNTADYSDNNAMLTAALAALPAAGGRIYIKPGVSLSGFAGATVALPAGKTVKIIGDHSSVPTNVPHLTFAASEGLACSSTGALVLTDLHVSYSGTSPILLQASPFKIRNVYMSNTATATSTFAAIRDGSGATAITGVDIDGLTFSTNYSAVQLFASLFRVFSGSITCSNTRIVNVTHDNAAHEASLFTIPNVANDVEIGHVTVNQSFASSGSVAPIFLLGSLDNTTNVQGRFVHDVTVNNTSGSTPSLTILSLATCGYLRISKIDTSPTSCTTVAVGSNVTGPIAFDDCLMTTGGLAVWLVGSCGDVTFSRCRFLNGSEIGIGDTAAVGRVLVDQCFFSGSYLGIGGNFVSGSTVESVRVTACTFDGVSDAASASFALFTVYGATASGDTGYVREARFLGNTVSDYQNVTYTGSDATTVPAMFVVNAHQADQVECSHTALRNIMNTIGGSGGNARRAPYLCRVTSATGGAGNFGDVNFEHNKSAFWGAVAGTFAIDACQAISITNFASINNLVMDANEFESPYNTGTDPRTNDFYYIDNGSASISSGINYLQWTRNRTKIWIGDTNPVSMAIDVLYCTDQSSSDGVIGQLVLTGNSLNGAYNSTAFNQGTRHGIDILNFITSITIVHNNIANRLNSTAISGFWKLNIDFPSNVNGDAGAMPGSGSSFPNCVNFWQL